MQNISFSTGAFLLRPRPKPQEAGYPPLRRSLRRGSMLGGRGGGAGPGRKAEGRGPCRGLLPTAPRGPGSSPRSPLTGCACAGAQAMHVPQGPAIAVLKTQTPCTRVPRFNFALGSASDVARPGSAPRSEGLATWGSPKLSWGTAPRKPQMFAVHFPGRPRGHLQLGCVAPAVSQGRGPLRGGSVAHGDVFAAGTGPCLLPSQAVGGCGVKPSY